MIGEAIKFENAELSWSDENNEKKDLKKYYYY